MTATDLCVTIVGNLTADPELRFTSTGTALANFTVAHTPRQRQDDGTWIDGETMYLRCTAWRDLAEHVAESLSRGARVVVVGRLRQSSWEGRDGERRTSVECTADEVGASLRFCPVTVRRAERRDGGAEPNVTWTTEAEPVSAS